MSLGFITVTTTAKNLPFAGMLKEGVFYNDSNNDIYYNWESEDNIVTTKESFKIPGKSQRTVSRGETINRNLKHINLRSSAGSNSLYFDFVTWGECPESGFTVEGNKLNIPKNRGDEV